MKIENFYNPTDRFHAPSLYNKIFGIIPSEYYFELDTETPHQFGNLFVTNKEDEEGNVTFDINSVDYKFIKDLYPEAEVFNVMCKFPTTDPVSCAEEKDESKGIYEYGSAYLRNEYHNAEVYVLLRNEKVLFCVDDNTVSLWYNIYDENFNPEKFIDELVEKLPKIVEDGDDEDIPYINLVSYNSTNGSFATIESAINHVDIDINKNYNDDFKPVYDDIVEFLGSDERKSGLILLNGEPGTGKTYFIRHLVTHFRDKNFVLITPSIASRLASPEFIEFLISNKDSIFILEDCEQVIMDRKANSFSSAVSSVLNMSDGLMSDVFNGKFICTFNADTDVIDDAIMRKGRCFANYTFEKLCEEKTKALLHDRGIDVDNPGELTLADIYNYKVGKENNDGSKKKIGF